MNYTQDEIQFLIDNYYELGSTECAKHLNRNIESLRIKATKKLGLVYSGIKLNKNRNVNPEHFYNIVKPEIAYWLGYFWADGHIHSYTSNNITHHRIAIEISQDDGIHLNKISSTFGKWTIVVRKRARNHFRPVMALVTNNKPLYEFLYENDYKFKSLKSPNKILNHIPENLHPAFWLGFLDGDGWCSSTRANLGFSGSYKQDWNSLDALLKSYNIKHGIYRYSIPTSEYSCVCIQNLSGVHEFYKYIKPFSYLGLERKQEKFIQLLFLKRLLVA